MIVQGDQIGRFVVERTVGVPGGQGRVFLAHDERGYQYALKVPHEVGQRFARELDAARAVISPYVARVWDFDLEHDPPYIAYGAVPGETLDRALSEREMDATALLSIFRQVALGLADIHAVSTPAIPQLTHGDLSLDNILVTDRNDSVIIDLGAARTGNDTAMSRDLFGKFGYFAPEQLKGDPGGPPADVWQLAVCLLRAATGRMPFGSGPGSVTRILGEPPNAVDSPALVMRVILQCLNKDPDARPGAAELAKELTQEEDRSKTRLGKQAGKVMRVRSIGFRVQAFGLIARQAHFGTSALGTQIVFRCNRDVCVGDQIYGYAWGRAVSPPQLRSGSRREMPPPTACPDCGQLALPVAGNWRWTPPDRLLGALLEDVFCPGGPDCPRQQRAEQWWFVGDLGGWQMEPELSTLLKNSSSPLQALSLRRREVAELWSAYRAWLASLSTQLERDVSGLCHALGGPDELLVVGLQGMLAAGQPWDPAFEPSEAQEAWWQERGEAVLNCGRAIEARKG